MAVEIRPVTEADAAAYNAYRRQIADEPDNMITFSRGEYTRSVDDERERILTVVNHPDQQILLAIQDETICGQCACRGPNKSALRHAVSLGIDVSASHRGQGIGTALMDAMIA